MTINIHSKVVISYTFSKSLELPQRSIHPAPIVDISPLSVTFFVGIYAPIGWVVQNTIYLPKEPNLTITLFKLCSFTFFWCGIFHMSPTGVFDIFLRCSKQDNPSNVLSLVFSKFLCTFSTHHMSVCPRDQTNCPLDIPSFSQFRHTQHQDARHLPG